MTHSMTDSIHAPMAYWSINYLSPESCVLSPSRSLRIPNSRSARAARGHAPTSPMRSYASKDGGGR